MAHSRFERTVKLQESARKSKNFTAGAPSVHGDHQSYELDTPPSHSNPESTPPQFQRFFASKSFKEAPVEPGGKEITLLVLRSAQLQEELSTLQDKYEVEIENHIRDSSDKEEQNITIQRLNAEKADLRHQVF